MRTLGLGRPKEQTLKGFHKELNNPAVNRRRKSGSVFLNKIAMKTFKNLFPQIVQFENLLSAAYKAARGKRERIYVSESWAVQLDKT